MLIKTTKKSTIGLTLFNWFKKRGGIKALALHLVGAARGVTHLGVLYALEEHHVPIQFIAGVSSGALVGGLYAAGVPVKLIIEKLGSISWRSFTNFHLSKRSLVSTNQTRQLIESLIGDKQLDDCEIPFLPVLTNILSGEETSLTQSAYSLATIIQAAIAFPGVFPPIQMDGQWYVDGGICCNLPVRPLLDVYNGPIIGVDVIPNIKLNALPKNAALMVDRSLDLMLSKQRQNQHPPDVLVEPFSTPYTSFDLNKYERMIEIGYRETVKEIPRIKQLIGA